MLEQEPSVFLDDLLKAIVLILSKLQQRIRHVLVDFFIIQVFQYSLRLMSTPPELVLVWLQLRFAANCTSFQVESHRFVGLLLDSAGVLHDDDVHVREDI